MKKYSFLKGLEKAAINTALVSLPIIVQLLPEAWMNMSVGAVLLLGINYLKVKYGN